VLTSYGAAYARTGTAQISAAGFIARFPIAVYPIALVLIVSSSTGQYGFAGVVSGCSVFGGALGNPVAAKLIDHFGQRRVLLPFLIAHAAVAAVFAMLISAHAPLWTLPVPAAGIGFSMVNVGAVVRARWSYVWADADAPRSTAYAIESILDEAIFVLGPLTATVLATHASSWVTLGFAFGAVAVGTLWLAGQRSTEPPVAEQSQSLRRGSALTHRGMLLITVTMLFIGSVFGSVEVTMVAFCGQHGSRASAGWVVASFACGSMIAGIGYGAVHWRAPVLHRFAVCATIFAVLPSLLFAATSTVTLSLLAATVGLGTAPTLIGGFALVDRIAPTSSLTEALTWIGTGMSVGYGLGASIVGSVADAHGARVAFAVPVACAFCAACFALGLARRLSRLHPRERVDSPDLQTDTTPPTVQTF